MEVFNHIYHVGDIDNKKGISCNPYLYFDGKEAVLIDPGSIIEFDIVWKNIIEIVRADQIKYIILHHQDPDICGCVGLLEEKGVNAVIVTSWRSKELIDFYGFQSEFYLIEEHAYQLTLLSGMIFKFILTPYLHFAGAFATYDIDNKVLFSSDLFGAYSYKHTLYADEEYMQKMLTFHETYMPSNDVIRPVMDRLSLMEIKAILPQHGSIIDKNVEKYINVLKHANLGNILDRVKNDYMTLGGFEAILRDIFHRLEAIYDKELTSLLKSKVSGVNYDRHGAIIGYENKPELIWEAIFNGLVEEKGVVALTMLEPYVKDIVRSYHLPIPQIYKKTIDYIQFENVQLLERQKQLEASIDLVYSRVLRCSVTGLYNEAFFRALIKDQIEEGLMRVEDDLVIISIDQLFMMNPTFKEYEEDTLIKMAYLLKEEFGENAVYRMNQYDYGLIVQDVDTDELIKRMDLFRNRIKNSKAMIGTITLSIGVTKLGEIDNTDRATDQIVADLFQLTLEKVEMQRVQGGDGIYIKEVTELENKWAEVLLVDADKITLGVIADALKNESVESIIATDGLEALEMIRKYEPKVVVTEIALNKLDGFLVREEIYADSKYKDIKFVYISHIKDKASIIRAHTLDVIHYIKKPYYLIELVGIIKGILRE